MENIYNMPTVTLIKAIDLIKPPATYLIDTFFSEKLPTANTAFVSIEFKKGKRTLAPYIIKGSKGVNVNREKSQSKFYAAPMMGVRRVITAQDIEMRGFGEQPVYSNLSPADRAARMVSDDLIYLQRMITNRKNAMAAELLQTGKIVIEGFADDGETIQEDVIDFNFSNISTATNSWALPATDIYEDIRTAADKIAEDVGELPNIMVCGKNVEKYLLANSAIKDWLMIPNAQFLTMASLQPHYISPQTRFIGNINSLGLEVYSYLETYFDDKTQTAKPFIDPDTVIIGIAGRGKQLTGAVTLLENGNWNTYAAEYVPHYTYDTAANQTALTLYSRFVPVPEVVESWQCIKVVPPSNVQSNRANVKGLPTLAEISGKK